MSDSSAALLVPFVVLVLWPRFFFRAVFGLPLVALIWAVAQTVGN